MRLKEVKDLFREYTAQYFREANVVFANQSRVAKTDIPLITIRTGNVKRPWDSVRMAADGSSVGSYLSRVAITVDLFTHGAPVMDERTNQVVAYENTAMDDMLSFADYIGSDLTTDWCSRKDIALNIEGDVQDLTGLVNDSNYEYRARINLMLYFTQQSVGGAGVLSESSIQYGTSGNPNREPMIDPFFEITSSGGGSSELAEHEAGYFTEVQIKEETGNE